MILAKYLREPMGLLRESANPLRPYAADELQRTSDGVGTLAPLVQSLIGALCVRRPHRSSPSLIYRAHAGTNALPSAITIRPLLRSALGALHASNELRQYLLFPHQRVHLLPSIAQVLPELRQTRRLQAPARAVDELVQCVNQYAGVAQFRKRARGVAQGSVLMSISLFA